MAKKVIACLTVIIAVCVLFSGCDLTLISTDRLIRPPKLSGESSFLQKAFEDTVKSDTAELKAPISGDNRSSYIIFDIDCDGNDDALVFYSDVDLDDFAHVAVFKNNGKEWKNISTITGYAEEIYEVNFNDVNGDGKYEVLISWASLNPISTVNETLTLVGDRILTLYTFNNAGMTLQKTEHFTSMYVEDFNLDGSDDIFLSTINISYDSNKTTGRIIRFNKECKVEYDESFSLIGMLDILSITSDTAIHEGQKYTRIYVDGLISDSVYVTDVVEFIGVGDKVQLPIHTMSVDTPITARSNKVFSYDIDNDGIIEVPTIQELPYSQRINTNSEEPTALNLVVWSSLNEDDFSPKFKCIYNKTQNYYFIFKEEWLNTITAVYNSNNSLLVFYTVDENGNIVDKICSIKSFSANSWNDNSYGFNLLYDSGAYIYGYIYDNSEIITKQDIQNSFVPLAGG